MSVHTDHYSTFRGTDHATWAALGLDAVAGAEMDYRNQDDDGPDQLQGEWFSTPDALTTDGRKVVFVGSFSQSHSPGASHYTTAYVFDATPEGDAAYTACVAEWEAKPEYTPEYEARGEQYGVDEGGDIVTGLLPDRDDCPEIGGM